MAKISYPTHGLIGDYLGNAYRVKLSLEDSINILGMEKEAHPKEDKSGYYILDDVKKYLGDEPIPRGNFPKNGDQPGIAKALAVSNGNLGNAFAIETVLVDGSEGLEMTGLPKESASDSAKIAITCIRKLYP